MANTRCPDASLAPSPQPGRGSDSAPGSVLPGSRSVTGSGAGTSTNTTNAATNYAATIKALTTLLPSASAPRSTAAPNRAAAPGQTFNLTKPFPLQRPSLSAVAASSGGSTSKPYLQTSADAERAKRASQVDGRQHRPPPNRELVSRVAPRRTRRKGRKGRDW